MSITLINRNNRNKLPIWLLLDLDFQVKTSNVEIIAVENFDDPGTYEVTVLTPDGVLCWYIASIKNLGRWFTPNFFAV